MVERAIAILTKLTRSLLKQSELPSKFWTWAWQYANYISNRSLCRGTAIRKTPRELAGFGKPDVSNIRVFGSLVYCHIEKGSRTKLSDQAWPGIFLGIPQGTKGYCVYNSESNSILVRRNVVFDESRTGKHLLSLPSDSTPTSTPVEVLVEGRRAHGGRTRRGCH